MIDSTNPPEQILDDWERCFSHFGQLNSASNVSLTVQEKRIRQYELNDQDLARFNVLILSVGWGDGYVSHGWNWDPNHIHDTSILNFVKNGGLLLLPEAGFSDDYGYLLPSGDVVPPTLALENLLSTQVNAFSMALLSLSGIGVLYTIGKGKYPTLEERYGSIASCLFLATFLWIIVPMLNGILLPQIMIVLWAILVDILAAVSIFVSLLWPRKS